MAESKIHTYNKRYRLDNFSYVTTTNQTADRDGIIVVVINTTENWGQVSIDGIVCLQFHGNTSIQTAHAIPIKAGQTYSCSYSSANAVAVKYFPYKEI